MPGRRVSPKGFIESLGPLRPGCRVSPKCFRESYLEPFRPGYRISPRGFRESIGPHIPNSDILTQAGVHSIYSLLSNWCLRWLDHGWCMEGGRNSKDSSVVSWQLRHASAT